MIKIDRKYMVCLVSIAVSLFLSLFKYLLFSYSDALPLQADAFHSFSDMLTSALVLFGVYLSTLSDRDGWIARISKWGEIFISTLIVVVVIYIGVGIASKIGEVRDIKNHYPVLVGTLITIFVTRWLYKYKSKVASEENSPSLRADALETRLDQISSVVVFLCIIGSKVGLTFENSATAVILVFVLYNGLNHLFSNGLNLIVVKVVEKSVVVFNAISKYRNNNTDIYQKIIKQLKIVGIAIGAILFLVYISSGFYTLSPGQVAAVKLFGKYHPELGKESGPHFVLPPPFGSVKIIDLDEFKRVEIAPLTDKMKYFITGDENLIDVIVAIQYKIFDIKFYTFNIEEHERLIRDVVESVTIGIIGNYGIDSSLIHKKQELLDEIKMESQNLFDRYEMGIIVLNAQFKKNSPPREVMQAFNEVSSAREDKRTFVDKAHEYYNSVIPEARGLAKKMIYEAEGYRGEVDDRSLGDCQRLTQVYHEYRKAPELFRKKEFFSTIDNFLEKSSIYFLDKKSSKNHFFRIYKK